MVYVHHVSTFFGCVTLLRILLVVISGWAEQEKVFWWDSGVSILSLITDVLEYFINESPYLKAASFLLAIARVILGAYPSSVYTIH